MKTPTVKTRTLFIQALISAKLFEISGAESRLKSPWHHPLGESCLARSAFRNGHLEDLKSYSVVQLVVSISGSGQHVLGHVVHAVPAAQCSWFSAYTYVCRVCVHPEEHVV